MYSIPVKPPPGPLFLSLSLLSASLCPLSCIAPAKPIVALLLVHSDSSQPKPETSTIPHQDKQQGRGPCSCPAPTCAVPTSIPKGVEIGEDTRRGRRGRVGERGRLGRRFCGQLGGSCRTSAGDVDGDGGCRAESAWHRQQPTAPPKPCGRGCRGSTLQHSHEVVLQ